MDDFYEKRRMSLLEITKTLDERKMDNETLLKMGVAFVLGTLGGYMAASGLDYIFQYIVNSGHTLFGMNAEDSINFTVALNNLRLQTGIFIGGLSTVIEKIVSDVKLKKRVEYALDQQELADLEIAEATGFQNFSRVIGDNFDSVSVIPESIDEPVKEVILGVGKFGAKIETLEDLRDAESRIREWVTFQEESLVDENNVVYYEIKPLDEDSKKIIRDEADVDISLTATPKFTDKSRPKRLTRGINKSGLFH